MLLPSDVARLVLGYLQQEGLYNSSRTFIHESPNLKEYAEHSTEDGAIPACVFSLLGKNLTTILNEYVAAKTKETNQEIPLVMTSLWKKLDLTISQIKSMQNSLRPVGLQMRTPNGMTTMRQRALTHSPVVLSTSLGGPTTISPASLMTHRMPVNSTPINYTFQPYRTTPIPMMQTPVPDPEPRVQTDLVNRDFPVQILVPDSRFATPSPMSPGRRKWDSPRRRGGALSGGSVLGRVNVSASTLGTEPQTEDSAGNENFPQLVIQNAREKILGDRSLQEKLAENINKILSSDTSPHTSKASCSAMDPDPSIDEILGLQGEIHMSNDAIQDILEQTESDPAFQALFDLFECGKTKVSGDPNQGDESVSSSPVESDKTELASDDIHTEAGDEGLVCEDPTTAHDVPTQMAGRSRSRSGLEHKTKKPRKSAPSSSSKTIPTSCGTRGLRREASQTTWSAGNEKQAAAPGRGDADAVFSDDGAAMEIDEPSGSPPCPPAPHRTAPQKISKPPEVEGRSPQPASQTSNVTVTLASTDSSVMDPTPVNSVLSATGTDCDVNRVEGEKPALGTGHTNVQTKNTRVECEPNIVTTPPPSTLGSPSSVAIVKPVTDRSKKTATANVSAPQGKTTVVPPEERDSHHLTSSTTSGLAGTVPNTNNSTAKTTTGSPATAFVPLSSTLFKNAAEDPNKIMTLNIIISDDQEEASSRSNTALNHAVSSISSDGIPTIFLSSPAKLPVKDPGSPFAVCIGQDETAQAVSGLQQSTEAPRAAATNVNPLSRGKAGTVAMSAPLVGVTAPAVVQRNNLQLTQGHPGDLAQPSYILQLPLDSTNRTIAGATTSYFLVTDPSSREGQARQVIVSTGVQGQTGPLTSTTPYVAATPPCSQGYPAGSAVFFTSPSKSLMQNMVLPVPVVGQNQPERFQLLSNQFVAMPSPGPVQQSEPVKSTPTQVASKDTAISIFHKTAPPAPKVTQAHTDNSIPQIVPSTAATKLVQPQAASHENTSAFVMKDFQPQLTENTVQSKVAAGTSPSHRRILCFDGSTKEGTGLITASTTTSKPSVSCTSASPLVQQAEKDSPRSAKTKPAILGGAKPKRRIETVRCIENTQTTPWAVSDTDKSSSPTQETEAQNKNTLKKSSDQKSNNAIHSRVGISSQHSDPQKRTESRRKSRSAVREDVEETKANHSERSTSLSSDLRLRSGSRKEKEETARRKPSEKSSEKSSAKVREGSSEKKTTAEPPKITANKENEVERAGLKEKEQQPSTSTPAPREFSPPPTVVKKPPTTLQGTTSKPAPKTPPKSPPKTPPKSLPRSRSRTPSKAPSKTASKMSPRTPSKTPSKTSPLIKAAEMLHDIQPPVTPLKRPAVGCQELPLPRTPGSGTGRLHEDPLDLTRTPTRQRPGRDGEGTPRHLVPPATPELPTCSPASEAGSENSINMAAHTLMILSRAAISRTGTPLKDSLRQEGAKGAKSPSAHKSKKRKQLEPPANPPAKKESRKSGTSGSKKKEKKQSKLLDSFPDDLDVDKFLSSLHYDE